MVGLLAKIPCRISYVDKKKIIKKKKSKGNTECVNLADLLINKSGRIERKVGYEVKKRYCACAEASSFSF